RTTSPMRDPRAPPRAVVVREGAGFMPAADPAARRIATSLSAALFLLACGFVDSSAGPLFPGYRLSVDFQPQDAASGDFNEDGIPDLVLLKAYGAFSEQQARIALGRGDGTFAQWVGYPAGIHPKRVRVADLNHDGHLDLVVEDDCSDPNCRQG